MRPFPSYVLTDAALEANASVVAVAVLSHAVAQQFSADTVARLVEISERSPPRLSASERQFLRDAISTADLAEIELSRESAA
jgi:hypothetical protein